MEKKYNYCVIDCQFHDWTTILSTHPNIKNLKNMTELTTDDTRIIVITVSDRYRYIDDYRACFKIDMRSIEILNDKCIFATYMMEKFPKNIPQTIFIKRMDANKSINYTNFDYDALTQQKFIKKDAIGIAGINTKIVYDIEEAMKQNNIIVSEYIEHKIFYSGHFLVHKNVIIEQIYFEASTKDDKCFIQKGRLEDYKICTVDELKQQADLSIFNNIFKDLSYSGFACVDFIIVDTHIVIFEINPRCGGTLIHNSKYFKQFFDRVINDQF